MNIADRARSYLDGLRGGRSLDLLRAIPLDAVVGPLLLIGSLYYGYVRLRFGIDLTDEAFYAVISQRVALGDRPYLDEINLRQGSSVLIAPLYWLYLKVVGSTEGVIHFLRQVYFGLLCVLAWTVFRLARTQVRPGYALIAASLPLAFVPFGTPTCSYNNLGAIFLGMGTCVGLRTLVLSGPWRSLAIAGALHALACLAYPPLALPVALMAATTPLVVRREGPLRPGQAALAYAGGVALVGGLYLIAFGRSMWLGYQEALLYEGMLTRPRTLDKVKGVLEAMHRLSPGYPSTVTSLAVAWLITRQAPRARPYLVPILILPLLWWFAEMRPEFRNGVAPVHTMSIHVVLYLGLLAGFLFLLLPERGAGRPWLLWGWLPSVVAGLVTAISSDNGGCMNAGIGLFAAALLCPIAAAMLAPGETAPSTDQAGPAEPAATLPPGPLAHLAVILGVALIPVQLLSGNYDSTYRDGPVEAQTTPVRVGPYRGMQGTPAKASQAEQLAQEIPPLAEPGERMLSYYSLPAAYLAVPTRPALPTSWTDTRAEGAHYMPYYQKHRTGRGLVVVTNERGKSPDLERLTQDPARLLKNLGWIRIYREPPP
jgi:hypothetical protein